MTIEKYQVPKGRWHGFAPDTVSITTTYVRFLTGFIDFLEKYNFCETFLDKEKRQLIFEFYETKQDNSLTLYKMENDFNLKPSRFLKVRIADKVITNKYIGTIEDNKIIVNDVIFK